MWKRLFLVFSNRENRMSQESIVIVGMARTPMGGFMGDLSPLKTPELGAAAIKAAVAQSGVKSDEIDEVIMGCVLPAALGQAPARQATLAAGLPLSTGATTVSYTHLTLPTICSV